MSTNVSIIIGGNKPHLFHNALNKLSEKGIELTEHQLAEVLITFLNEVCENVDYNDIIEVKTYKEGFGFYFIDKENQLEKAKGNFYNSPLFISVNLDNYNSDREYQKIYSFIGEVSDKKINS
jgi:hypothetical protein